MAYMPWRNRIKLTGSLPMMPIEMSTYTYDAYGTTGNVLAVVTPYTFYLVHAVYKVSRSATGDEAYIGIFEGPSLLTQLAICPDGNSVSYVYPVSYPIPLPIRDGWWIKAVSPGFDAPCSCRLYGWMERNA